MQCNAMQCSAVISLSLSLSLSLSVCMCTMICVCVSDHKSVKENPNSVIRVFFFLPAVYPVLDVSSLAIFYSIFNMYVFLVRVTILCVAICGCGGDARQKLLLV